MDVEIACGVGRLLRRCRISLPAACSIFSEKAAPTAFPQSSPSLGQLLYCCLKFTSPNCSEFVELHRMPQVACLIKSSLVLLLTFMFASKLVQGGGNGYI